MKNPKHHLRLSKKISTSAVANDLQSIHKMPSLHSDVTTAPTEEQRPIQNINSTFANAAVPKKENIATFLDSIPRGIEKKHLNSQVKEERIHLKVFPSVKTNQLDHYVIPNVRGIQLRLCYNSRRLQEHSSKQRYVRTEAPSKKIMLIGAKLSKL